jgi:hypothetical protein
MMATITIVTRAWEIRTRRLVSTTSVPEGTVQGWTILKAIGLPRYAAASILTGNSGTPG